MLAMLDAACVDPNQLEYTVSLLVFFILMFSINSIFKTFELLLYTLKHHS